MPSWFSVDTLLGEHLHKVNKSAWYAAEIWHMNSAAKQNAQALRGIEDICQQSPFHAVLTCKGSVD